MPPSMRAEAVAFTTCDSDLRSSRLRDGVVLAELSVIRRAYAKHVLAAAGVSDPGLEDAFATIAREDFLGPGPWPILRWMRLVDPLLVSYARTPSADPVYLYTDDLVGIVPERRINNGQPSFHAWLMSHARPALGERVVHVGAGSGYYSAILAHLVGRRGRLIAIEYDPDLAARAAKNLATHSHVRVINGDGATIPLEPADIIYVNAGTNRPADTWLNGLTEGGRLVLPLTVRSGLSPTGTLEFGSRGGVFLIERRGVEFFARWISPVAIFPCNGSDDPNSDAALANAFKNGGWDRVTRLYRHDDIPDDRCWLKGPGWCLAYG
jgi:protein-L-isoaspartate(D-aspartate) O-methyltransferase